MGGLCLTRWVIEPGEERDNPMSLAVYFHLQGTLGTISFSPSWADMLVNHTRQTSSHNHNPHCNTPYCWGLIYFRSSLARLYEYWVQDVCIYYKHLFFTTCHHLINMCTPTHYTFYKRNQKCAKHWNASFSECISADISKNTLCS